MSATTSSSPWRLQVIKCGVTPTRLEVLSVARRCVLVANAAADDHHDDNNHNNNDNHNNDHNHNHNNNEQQTVRVQSFKALGAGEKPDVFELGQQVGGGAGRGGRAAAAASAGLVALSGPNGAGKSTLLEALMFALGAPASALRVRALRDVMADGGELQQRVRFGLDRDDGELLPGGGGRAKGRQRKKGWGRRDASHKLPTAPL